MEIICYGFRDYLAFWSATETGQPRKYLAVFLIIQSETYFYSLCYFPPIHLTAF